MKRFSMDVGEEYPVFYIVPFDERYMGSAAKLPEKLLEQFKKIEKLWDAMQIFLNKRYDDW